MATISVSPNKPKRKFPTLLAVFFGLLALFFVLATMIPQLDLFPEFGRDLSEIEVYEDPSPLVAVFVLALSTLAMVALLIAPHRIGTGL